MNACRNEGSAENEALSIIEGNEGKEKAKVQITDLPTELDIDVVSNFDRGQSSANVVSSLIETATDQDICENYASTLSEQELDAQISHLELTVEMLENEHSEMNTTLEKERALYQQRRDEESLLDSDRHLEREADIGKEKADRLLELLAEHDEIKQKENEFKEKCRGDMEEMLATIERLSVDDQSVAAGEVREGDRESVVEELGQKRLQLAELNRALVSIQRKLDETPSQTELNQYQRRFLELYNQMASKHRETKQFFALHNTLVDIKTYMQTEIDLLDNIYNVQNLASQDEYKQSFLEKLEKLLDGVRQSKSLVDRRNSEMRVERDSVRGNHQELIDKHRLYYKTVDDFQRECKRNEKLLEELERRSSQSPIDNDSQ